MSAKERVNADFEGSTGSFSANDPRWFRTVADYTIDWESWHAPNGNLIWVNPAVERITGYSVAECLAMPEYPLPIVAPEDRGAVADALAAAQAQASGEHLEFRSLSRTGELRWVSLSWQPMYDSEQRHLGFRTSVRDITERQRLREQLRLHAEHLEQLVQERTQRLRQLEQRQRQMEKMVALGELAAGVAHEINNPLAGLRMAFELIKSSFSPDHEYFELCGLIDKEIERISGITHQMHQLYKRTAQQPGEFSMTRSVGEVIWMLENTAAKLGVQVRFDAPEDPLPVLLVEGEVKQILYNVIQNALQVSSPGSEVGVTIRIDEKNVVLEVKDEGPGIPDELLERIFEPFFSTKHDETHSGMGLGLSVSRSLAEAMGGRIEVESNANHGSLFSIILPARVAGSREDVDG
jgi:PAS domain S-box-containing protein